MLSPSTPPGVRPSFLERSTSPPSDQHNRSSSSLAWNPITLRLYKVLGANFEDPGTKEALETLSAFYTTSSTVASAPTGERNGLDDTNSDSEDESRAVAEAQKVVIHMPGDSAARARKNLRRDTQAKVAEGSQIFLKAFGEVDKVRCMADPVRPSRSELRDSTET